MAEKNIREKLEAELKENANLFQNIKRDHNLDKEDFIFVLGDKNAFKQKFLILHYKMYNILQEINTKINELRNNKLSEEELKQYLTYFYDKK